MKKRTCYVYMLAGISRGLYTGMTNNLLKRVEQHKDEEYGSAFIKRYYVN